MNRLVVVVHSGAANNVVVKAEANAEDGAVMAVEGNTKDCVESAVKGDAKNGQIGKRWRGEDCGVRCSEQNDKLKR